MTIVNLVRQRTKNLSTEEIRGSLRRCKARWDFPTSPDEMLAPMGRSTAKRRRDHRPAEVRRRRPSR
jgi:hypothetical protein